MFLFTTSTGPIAPPPKGNALQPVLKGASESIGMPFDHLLQGAPRESEPKPGAIGLGPDIISFSRPRSLAS